MRIQHPCENGSGEALIQSNTGHEDEPRAEMPLRPVQFNHQEATGTDDAQNVYSGATSSEVTLNRDFLNKSEGQIPGIITKDS
jgi:hypothetical protein